MFNPEKEYLEHSDAEHEQSLEKKSFDFEYQREFRDYFLSVLAEVNIDISDSLMKSF